MSERTYRRHSKYREAQLSPEFSQFLERSRNDNSAVNSENVTIAGCKRRADESVGYLEQRADGNYEGTGGASSQVGSSDSVRRNATHNVNVSLNVQ